MVDNFSSLPIHKIVQHLTSAEEPIKSRCAEEIIKRFEPLLRKAWKRGAFYVEYTDFVQDVFTKLFSGISSLREPKSFPGYFRRVALSVAADHAKKSDPYLSKEITPEDTIIKSFEKALLSKLFIRSYMEELTPRERQVITMFFLNELSIADIAINLMISKSAVRATKTRGLKNLRELLRRDAYFLKK
jgi:RNA polymerase sigma factor (sigma-70 family)